MTRCNYRFLIPLFVLVLITRSVVLAGEMPRVQPEELGFSPERLQRIHNVFQAYVDDGKLAGGVALVARHGKVAYLESFGLRDRESGSPMQDDSIFRIASQTKALVSVSIMMLQEEGLLLISDPVGKYLPEFQETTVAISKESDGYEVVKAERPVTIRDLLTHTSGIGYGDGPAADRWQGAGIQGWYFADRDEPIRETVSRMAALPFDAQPGEQFVYGYSTDILGTLVETVSGEPLDEFLTTRLLTPLGMEDTHFYLPQTKKERLATVYSPASPDSLVRTPDQGGMVSQGAYIEGPRKSFSGGAGLLSTAMDYAKFLQMMLNGGEFDGKHILSPKTVELMTMNHLGKVSFPWAEGTGFGLGFYVIENPGTRGLPESIGEYGWGGAYHSTYWVDPKEQLLVIYLTQLIPANDLDDHEKLRALVYQALLD